jgi:hypothetical protein
MIIDCHDHHTAISPFDASSAENEVVTQAGVSSL